MTIEHFNERAMDQIPMHELITCRYNVTTRRCAFQRKRFRWTIAVPDKHWHEHSTISYSTESEAFQAGSERARKLDLAPLHAR